MTAMNLYSAGKVMDEIWNDGYFLISISLLNSLGSVIVLVVMNKSKVLLLIIVQMKFSPILTPFL